jgi:signal transduction histidine kinase
MKRDSCRPGGPPWWPANEPWPPQHGRFGMDRRVRVRFFRRMALVAFVVLGLALAGVFAAAWLVASRFDLPAWTGPVAAVLVIFAAATVLVGMFGVMRRFASPLGQVMDAADRVADGDYGVRVEEYGPPPMRALAHSFNTMTERLQHADRLRRDLMGDLAHELRTPLSVLRGRLEGLLDGVYPRDDRQIAELLDETQVLSRLVEDLRTLALSDAGALPLQKEPTDLVELARDAIRSLNEEARRKSIALNLTSPTADVVVDVDPLRMREVLTNLLSNAIRHTPAESTVTVTVSKTTERATVAVVDSGEGISPQDLSRIFDRFYKGATSHGSGLGLTIAKGVVAAHGGEMTASSQPGRGTAVTFTLPRLSTD